MSGVEKCGLQLRSSLCFSVQRHWGFTIVALIQLSLPFTITHYNTIMSAWKYCVPLPRFKYLYTCRGLGSLGCCCYGMYENVVLMERHETISKA